MPCRSPYLNETQRTGLESWMFLLSMCAILSTMVVQTTFLLDTARFTYPERPIVYLSFCYLFVAIGYVLQVFTRKLSFMVLIHPPCKSMPDLTFQLLDALLYRRWKDCLLASGTRAIGKWRWFKLVQGHFCPYLLLWHGVVNLVSFRALLSGIYPNTHFTLSVHSIRERKRPLELSKTLKFTQGGFRIFSHGLKNKN